MSNPKINNVFQVKRSCDVWFFVPSQKEPGRYVQCNLRGASDGNGYGKTTKAQFKIVSEPFIIDEPILYEGQSTSSHKEYPQTYVEIEVLHGDVLELVSPWISTQTGPEEVQTTHKKGIMEVWLPARDSKIVK